jgi:hypothetical protein
MLMKHPEIEIAQLSVGDLDGEDRARALAHLLSCKQCQQLRRDLEWADAAISRAEARLDLPPFTENRQERSGPWSGVYAIAATLVVVVAGLALVPRLNAGTSVASSTPSATVVCSSATAGDSSIEVCPSSGPVGTLLTISGTNCGLPGRDTPVALVFSGDTPGSGTAGGMEMASAPIDKSGRFTTSFAVPAALQSTQGYGGGPVRPGAYRITSLPPYCVAPFTVTAR